VTVIDKAERFTESPPSTAWRKWVLLVGALVALAAGIYIVYFSSLLTVHEERVLGAVHVSADAVRQAAAVPAGTQLARVDVNGVTQRVGALPWVQSVEVRRGWPNVLVIVVGERTPIAVVPVAKAFTYIDATATTFDSVAKPPAGLPVLSAGDSDRMQAGVAVVAALPPDFRKQVSRVAATTRDNVILTLTDHSFVQWGSAQDSERKYAVLAALMHLHARFYDVSAPDLPTTRGTAPMTVASS
jgi:cell division protein FtsQ